MLYKDLLKDVRKNLKEVRKEFKRARNTEKVYNEFLLEHKKLRDLSQNKKFFLGKKKDKPYLEWLNEEIKTFLDTPNIRKSDREERHKKSLDSLMNNYDIDKETALKFIDFMNDDIIKSAIERGILSSEQIAELVEEGYSLKKLVRVIEKHKNTNFDSMSNTELEEFWRNELRKRKR